jgi:nitrous oxide reductase accessory protein NosL
MRKILLATLTAGALSAGIADAATTTTTFQVTATVQATCSTTALPLSAFVAPRTRLTPWP